MDQNPQQPQIKMSEIIKPYLRTVAILVIFGFLANGLNLITPRLIGQVLDRFGSGQNYNETLVTLGLIFTGVLIITLAQLILTGKLSQKVGFDYRNKLINALSKQPYKFIQQVGESKLLSIFTSDIDAVRDFIAMGLIFMLSSIILLIGSIIILLSINLPLALMVLAIVPLIGLTFFFVFGKISAEFEKSRINIDNLNQIITESIVGSALVRVLHTQKSEKAKFDIEADVSKKIGYKILMLFGTMFPLITFFANIAIVGLLWFGGNSIINNSLSIGDFVAFNSYIGLLIEPIIMIGFMSSMVARAFTSLARINEVVFAPQPVEGTLTQTLDTDVTFKNIGVTYGEKTILKDISFKIKKGTRNAIVGPTAAGKTQLMYILSQLTSPTEGEILIGDTNLRDIDPQSYYEQFAIVFQDSILLNASVRENVLLDDTTHSDETVWEALETAEMKDFVAGLPNGLDTNISERGTNLSGGQKQRIMLARALVRHPSFLVLDDFTARVDKATEKRVIANVLQAFPHATQVWITQKIESIIDFDQIIFIMEGELLGVGTHEELLKSSFEYKQLYQSQKSTE